VWPRPCGRKVRVTPGLLLWGVDTSKDRAEQSLRKRWLRDNAENEGHQTSGPPRQCVHSKAPDDNDFYPGIRANTVVAANLMPGEMAPQR